MQILGHALQLRTQLTRTPGEQEEQQEKVERVDVIISRLLKVRAVVPNLKVKLLADNLFSAFYPSC